MSATVGFITMDCGDVSTVAGFWSAALGIPLDPGANGYFASLNRNAPALPRMMFLKVPEAKTAKNRVHLDLLVDRSIPRAQEVARLVELGATHLADKDEWGHSWAVLSDPEGNEFCIAAPRE